MIQRNRRAIRAVLLACFGASALSLAACTQPELFPGDVAPTQAQSNAMGWPAPHYINVDDGDNEDPSVDMANYPYAGGTPWYLQPGYLGG